MKKYMVYLEIKEDVFKMAVPAKNEDDALAYVKGNGDVIAIKDVKPRHAESMDSAWRGSFYLFCDTHAGRLKR